MVQYILECIAFQLVFLIIYDFFLKRETFFQWNRLYLLGTHVLSLLLPWIKIEAFKTTMPVEYYVYPEFLWNMQTNPIELSATGTSWIDISWEEGVFMLGILAASVLFAYKMWQLYRLRKKGEVHYFTEFTLIIVANSNFAFSFFKSIFLGDDVVQDKHENIIKHELVHLRQKHSYDLLFFELLRIVFWFNPLVYVYQNRISELHEFIADAHVSKTNKKEQYQLLLSQVFQTQHISFINQFFKSSLIKKRIVMLQKSRSKKVWRLKYLLLLPIVLGMLFYTSLEGQETNIQENNQDQKLIEKIRDEVNKDIENSGSIKDLFDNKSVFVKYNSQNPILLKEDFFRRQILWQEMTKEINRKNNKGALKSNLKDLEDPSTILYNSYFNRERAFQLLDENLRISIDAYKQDVRLISSNEIKNDKSYVFKVNHLSNLTANEIRSFNGKMEEVFENESSYSNIILTDDRNVVRVLNKIDESMERRSVTRDSYTFPKKTEIVTSTIIKDTQEEVEDVPFAVIDEAPIFPGCENEQDLRECFQLKLQLHISKNFKYPGEAQKQGIQGRVNIMFTIDQNGDITNIRKRGPDPLLEDEAHRIISLLPQMNPGKQKGQPVNVPFSIPITFKLGGDEQNKAEDSNKAKTVHEMSISGNTKMERGKKYIYGAVTDGSRGLPGVNVIVKGTNRAVVTNFDGEFTIEVQKGDIITFQYIGLPTAMLTVTDQEKYTVTTKK